MDMQKRIESLLDLLKLGEMVLIRASMASHDGLGHFRQNSNFFYLTNFNYPNGIVIIGKRLDGRILKEIYVEEDDPIMAKWIGHKPSLMEVTRITSLKSLYLKQFFMSPSVFNGIETIYTELKKNAFVQIPSEDALFMQMIRERCPEINIKDITPIIAPLRMKKSNQEIKAIQKAIQITFESLKETIPFIRSGENEKTIESYLECGFRKRFADIAFNTIVASGHNATVLHYTDNNRELKSRELILLDFGAQWNHYCADISRTLPINGKYTKKNKAFYKGLLEIQKEIISYVKPGVTIRELQSITIDRITKFLIKMKVMRSKTMISKYYYHSIGHHLGLDVHDIFTSHDIPLEPGMVITIEPGIYIQELGIGIRIEDDVLITNKGNKVLSNIIPKEPDDILNLF